VNKDLSVDVCIIVPLSLQASFNFIGDDRVIPPLGSAAPRLDLHYGSDETGSPGRFDEIKHQQT